MPKRRKLTEVEEFFIKNHGDMPVDELVKTLGRGVTEEMVKEYKSHLTGHKSVAKANDDRIAPIDAGKLMGRNREAVVMTKEASEASDEFKKNMPIAKNPNVHPIKKV